VTARTIAVRRSAQDAVAAATPDYCDTFEDRVKDLVDAKRRGEDVVSEDESPDAGNVLDLMDALQKSVGGARSKNVRRSGARRGEVHQLGARRRGKQ